MDKSIYIGMGIPLVQNKRKISVKKIFNALVVTVFIVIASGCDSRWQVIPGHAHNDYENEIPLWDAIDNGFISVEVDVYLIEDQLYVSHYVPYQLDSAKTLQALYLDPLSDHISNNGGFVYPGYTNLFYLMVDFKTAAIPTYKKLKVILSDYRSIISVVENGIEQAGPVKIIISGNRPIEEVLRDEPKMTGLDGRLNDLDKNIPAYIMPVVSDNYLNYFVWTGHGKMSDSESQKLKNLVQITHAQNKHLRLWAAPDHPNAWKLLLDHGVDLISTDRLSEFRKFMAE